MDPLSQAVVGASLSQSLSQRLHNSQAIAFLAGIFGGMAADLDIFIRSVSDPLLFLEYHRQFTHALIFIPVGSLPVALLLWWLLTRFSSAMPRFATVWLLVMAGYATHGLLDACTSYGTQLLWPFSDQRIAWHLVSIVDPLFTLPVMVLVIAALWRKQAILARVAFGYAVLYLALGLVQKHRAEQLLLQLAQQRQHPVERMLVKPTFGNRHVWKLLYESQGYYYVDAVKLLDDTKLYPGERIRKFVWPAAQANHNRQHNDIQRFARFSDNYLAIDPQQPDIIFDVRYSLLPNRFKMMWGIRLREPDEHVMFVEDRHMDKATRQAFFAMLF